MTFYFRVSSEREYSVVLMKQWFGCREGWEKCFQKENGFSFYLSGIKEGLKQVLLRMRVLPSSVMRGVHVWWPKVLWIMCIPEDTESYLNTERMNSFSIRFRMMVKVRSSTLLFSTLPYPILLYSYLSYSTLILTLLYSIPLYSPLLLLLTLTLTPTLTRLYPSLLYLPHCSEYLGCWRFCTHSVLQGTCWPRCRGYLGCWRLCTHSVGDFFTPL